MSQFKEAKPRARIAILSYIAQFSLQRYFGVTAYGGSPDMAFSGSIASGAACQVGDLVALSAAPASKWYLSWLHQVSGETYTLESIEDGELCDWSNVGLMHYDRANVASHPEWRWTDRQFQFYDRWKRACYKTRDAYLYLPMHPEFGEDGSVALGVRVRHGFGETLPTSTFPDWRKVTIKRMLEFYDEMVDRYGKQKKNRGVDDGGENNVVS